MEGILSPVQKVRKRDIVRQISRKMIRKVIFSPLSLSFSFSLFILLPPLSPSHSLPLSISFSLSLFKITLLLTLFPYFFQAHTELGLHLPRRPSFP